MEKKRKRLKRIIFEVTDGFYEMVKDEAKEQNISLRSLITRLLLTELTKRRELRSKNR